MKITNKMRFMLIMLSVLMVLSLFACAETPEETTTKAPEATTEKPTETTEKTEPTEAPVDTDATDAPVVNETTDVDVAETTENETESESASETASESATESDSASAETTETETTEAPACDHAETEVDAAVAPTCEETGLTEGSHCVLCGAVVVAQETVPAKGHAWDEGVVTTEPTCETAGVKTYTCANDATHTYTAEIPAGDHAWDNGVVTTEATCEAKGVKTYTCSKDATHIYTEEIPAKGHAYDEGVVTTEPTCVDKGVKTFTCANDPSHSYTEEIPENGHTEATDKAVAPTCEEKGLTEGKHCSVCSVVLVPQEEIDATGHSKVDVAFMAPTTAEEGWEAYKSCENCDKLWNAEDEEIDAIPTIEKIVPTTDMYFGFEELKNKQVNGTDGSKFAVEAAADRTYVRFKRTGDSNDGNIYLLDGNTAVTGKYMVIKYKTDHMVNVQVWANAVSNGHDGGKSNTYVSFLADGNWHIAVIDLASRLSTYVVADENGDYTIQWARIDLLDGAGSSGYIDVAYITYCDDLADVAGLITDGDEAYCSHIASSNPTFTNRGENHSTECVICGSDMFYQHSISTPTWNVESQKYAGSCACGKVVESPMLYVTEGYINGTVGLGRMSAQRFEEEGVTRYTVTSTGDVYFHVYAEGTAVTGQYVVIKYRASNNGNDATFGNWFAGSVMDTTHSMATNGDDQCSGGLGTIYADGEWHYLVVKANSRHFIINEDGTYSYEFLRLGIHNNTLAIGSYIEVDEVAFADDRYAIDLYINGGEAVCAHEHGSTTWDSEAKVYNFVCTYCGEKNTSDVLYSTEAILGSAKHNNFEAAQMDGFVRYYATGSADPYFYAFTGVTQVTGQYAIIKYRVVNNGSNPTQGSMFAGSLASGNTQAMGNGDSGVTTSGSYIGDGEWHYMVYSPKSTNTKFAANADGTYTWRYLRLGVANMKAYDKSCYFDIDEIVFVDNLDAAESYLDKNSADVEYKVNLDVGNNNLNGGTFLEKAIEGWGGVTIDMSQYAALDTPTSLTIGGWVCVRGGVESYKVRVTSVDGAAVENPELNYWVDGILRNDIYTGVGEGLLYSSDCAKGAGMGVGGGSTIDLTEYAGHTVNFEIVAITNFGDEIVAVRVNNVVVPAAPVAE